MARPLIIMAICVLVAIALPRSTYGRAAIDHSGSVSNTLLVRDSKLDNPPDRKQQQKEAIVTSLIRGSASVPVKSRQKRLSDQRLAELETLITLSFLSRMLAEARYKKLDPATIGRRRRASTRLVSPGQLTPTAVVRHRHHTAN